MQVYLQTHMHPDYNVMTDRFSLQNLNFKSTAYIPCTSTPSCLENVSHVKAEVINKWRHQSKQR